MKKTAGAFCFALCWAGALAPAAVAGDASRGEEKSASCAQCHGADGNSPIADYPKIAGQHADYLRYSLKAYRDGRRQHLLMSPQVQALSDKDIDDLAAYFSAQEGDLR